jgi:succinate dehydrogenase / fumarate reductase flavoprotein subunit
MSAEWRKLNLICRLSPNGDVVLKRQNTDPMREDLITLFDRDELEKYLTEAELPGGTAAPISDTPEDK